MTRYTISDQCDDQGLHVVLDRGSPTQALAKEGVTFADKCELQGGIFHGGTFQDGIFYGGHFYSGIFYDGVFNGGHFNGGYFHDGHFYGGIFNGGHFNGGYFHGGYFHGGHFHGGRFNGGTFNGGTFNGGTFHGGVFRDEWLPLQIRGSMNMVNIPDCENIQIGCECHRPEIWQEKYKYFGEENGYTDEQIVEYKRYIDLATIMIEEALRRSM